MRRDQRTENRQLPEVSFNDKDNLPGRLQGHYISKSRHAGPVKLIALILIMASLGWAGSLS